MAKKPIAFISFRFEPISSAVMFDDPSSREQTAALSLLIWRNKAGRAEVSETHELGRAHSIEQFERLVKQVEDDLRRATRDASEWFPARRSFWR